MRVLGKRVLGMNRLGPSRRDAGRLRAGRGRRTAVHLVAVATAGAVLAGLAGCSGGDEPKAAPSPSASPSPTTTVSVPPSVSLTDPGAALSFGDTASVVYEPDQKRGTVLELTVEKAQQGRIEDFSSFVLEPEVKQSTPYYVTVSVSNVGEGEIGGDRVPLWGVDGADTLLPPAAFTTAFSRCPSEPLPDTFAPGDDFDTCLVFLAPEHGTLSAISFRPDEEFDPITWTGDVAPPKSDKSGAKGKKSDTKPGKPGKQKG
jgi:hypothetical protein